MRSILVVEFRMVFVNYDVFKFEFLDLIIRLGGLVFFLLVEFGLVVVVMGVVVVFVGFEVVVMKLML